MYPKNKEEKKLNDFFVLRFDVYPETMMYTEPVVNAYLHAFI